MSSLIPKRIVTKYQTSEKTTCEEYFIGKKNQEHLHREDGPASIFRVNNKVIRKEYRINGEKHRDNGPALIYFEEREIIRKVYYRCDKKHRIDGPAIVDRERDIKRYFIHGKKLNYVSFHKITFYMEIVRRYLHNKIKNKYKSVINEVDLFPKDLNNLVSDYLITKY